MKIAFLTERMLLGYGVDLVVHEQATRLQKLGHDVIVFAARADMTVKRSYEVRLLSDVLPGFHDFTNENLIRSFLAKRDAAENDVWLLHTPPFYTWIRYIEKPAVIVEHGCPPGHFFDQATAYHLWRTTFIHHAKTYSYLRDGDAILSISQDIHNHLPEQAKRYSTVLHHGADHYPKAHLDEILRFRSRCGADEGDFLVLWVGRMQFAKDEQPYKGFAELLRLLPKINKIASRKVKVACVGKIDNSETSRFDEIDATLIGQLPPDQMGVAYAAADVFLNLSRWEGFNLALVESQYQGTPVVAYDLGPHPEVTQRDRSALLVQDAEQVVEALRRLQQDPALRADMGRNAEQFASPLSWDENCRQLSDLLEECQRRYRAASHTARTCSRDVHVDGPSSPPASVISTPQIEEAEAALIADIQGSTVTEAQIDELLKLSEAAFIEGAYVLLLDRAPDETGRAHYIGNLARGKSRLSVLRDLAASEECRRRQLSLPHILSKTSGARFLTFKRDLLSVGGHRQIQELNATLALEGEAFVNAAYRLMLGQLPDEVGLGLYTRWLRQTGDKLAILIDLRRLGGENSGLLKRGRLVGSLYWRRFVRRPVVPPILRLDDTEFVREAYALILGRDADEGGFSHYVRHLRKTGDKRKILRDIWSSPEGQARFEQHEKLRKALKRYRKRERLPQSSFASLLSPLHEQCERMAMLERRLHDIDLSPRGRSDHGEIATGRTMGVGRWAAGSAGKKLSPPWPYVTDLNQSHVCLHAPGVQIDEDGYARLAHLAAMTHADIVFANEWIVPESGDPFPLLRSAFSPFSFAENPDLGGVIAVERSLLARAGLPTTVALTGNVLLRIVAQAHSIVHHPNLLSQRHEADLRSNLPSESARLTLSRRFEAASDITAATDGGPRKHGTSSTYKSLILVACDNPDTPTKPKWSLPAGHVVRRVPREGGAAAINAAVRHAADCSMLIFIDESLTPPSGNWLGRLADLALARDVGLVSGLVLTPDAKIVDSGWQVGPRGMVSPNSRLRPCPESQEDPARRLNEVSAVSLHFAAMRRSLFLDIGGVDEKLSDAQIGIDLSIRLRSFQLSILLDGHSVARGFDAPLSIAIGDTEETRKFLRKHQGQLQKTDSYSRVNYNGHDESAEIHREIMIFDLEDIRRTIVAPSAQQA